MHTIVFVLACLSSAGQGRRVTLGSYKDKAATERQDFDKSTSNPSESFATLLLLQQNPAAAFGVFPAGAHFRTGNHASMRFCKTSVMQSPIEKEPPTELQVCDTDDSCAVVECEKGECVVGECVGNRKDAGISYKAQFEELFAKDLDVSRPVPKPSNAEQAKESNAKRVPFSDVFGTRCVRMLNRRWTKTDKIRVVFFTLMHGLGLLVPFFFTWKMFAIHFALYIVSGLGITYSYHRQLSHKSFKSPKWLEYMGATAGMLGMQGAPLDWASEHRYHHLHTETPLDPHSIYEGFYWSHMGWLLDSEKKEARCADMSNAKDMSKQKFYQLTSKYYKFFVLAHWALMYGLGGFAGVVWRAFWVSVQYHVTWFVNSASHVWGNQEYRTGDQSRNNWWVGILAFGEGWHNNHHAFEYSARHGLRRHQIDTTWMIIRLFRKLGLVTNVKLPTERAKQRLRLKPEA